MKIWWEFKLHYQSFSFCQIEGLRCSHQCHLVANLACTCHFHTTCMYPIDSHNFASILSILNCYHGEQYIRGSDWLLWNYSSTSWSQQGAWTKQWPHAPWRTHQLKRAGRWCMDRAIQVFNLVLWLLNMLRYSVQIYSAAGAGVGVTPWSSGTDCISRQSDSGGPCDGTLHVTMMILISNLGCWCGDAVWLGKVMVFSHNKTHCPEHLDVVEASPSIWSNPTESHKTQGICCSNSCEGCPFGGYSSNYWWHSTLYCTPCLKSENSIQWLEEVSLPQVSYLTVSRWHDHSRLWPCRRQTPRQDCI